MLIFSIYFIFFEFVYCDLRIINGENAEAGEFPFSVSLRDKDQEHFCGGSILNDNYILTAAHCLCDKITNTPPYSIQFGSLNITRSTYRSIAVASYSCHENFDPKTMLYDVAVIKLQSPLPKGDWGPVEIAQEFVPQLQTKGIAIGWGLIWDGGPRSRILQKLQIDVYLDNICKQKFNIDHHICGGHWFSNSGVCEGDSGSALLVNGIQVGITSFITAGCGSSGPTNPNVFSRVPEYYQWIKNKTVSK